MNAVLRQRGLKPAAELAAKYGHGLRVKYLGGCRCVPCRAANSRYESARLRARAAGAWNGIVDAAPARAHLLELRWLGIGRRTVHKLAKVSDSVLQEILAGRKKRCRAETLRRILWIEADQRYCRGTALVDAAPTWRLINDLLAEGYSRRRIADAMGYKNGVIQLRRDVIAAKNRTRVFKAYQLLKAEAA